MKQNKFVIYGMRETYHELGLFEIRIVLNPKFFKNGHGSFVEVRDSDGKRMYSTFEVWGRKINCKFKIDENVSDGVAVVDIKLADNSGKTEEKRSTFWVIK